MRPSRRALLWRAAAWAAAAVVSARGVAAASTPERQGSFTTDPFALGVASGDPSGSGATIWTRLIGPEFAPLEAPLRVRWEVAENERFSRIVRAGQATAAAEAAHALHIDIAGLRPGRDYFYRFHAGDVTSRTGRMRTLPERTESFRMALAACQHWEHGYFSAYADLVRQAPDLVLQVGDYIYEKSFGDGPDVRQFPLGDPTTLAAYRLRHALYKTDPHLQAAHAAAAWLVAPDDHEVENDYAGAFSALSDSAAFLARRAAAYQAYLEHMPISLSRLSAEGLRFYGKAEIGDLARLYLLDTRQYRSPQPGAAEGRAQGGLVSRTSAESSAVSRSMLGPHQEEWLIGSLACSQPDWTILAQQTLFAPLDIRRPDGPAIWSDLWDGYPQSRDAVLGALAREPVGNALVLGGDVHSFWRNDLRYRDRVVANEIVTSCLASRNGPAALFASAQADNAHIGFLDNTHAGYVLLDIGRRQARATYRAVHSLRDPNAEAFTLHTEDIARRSG